MSRWKVLIGCERSGVIREAFRAVGCDAYSCDLAPAEDGSPFHLQMDTCLWLKGLPPLESTDVLIKKRYANQTPSGQNKLGPSPTRHIDRARTYPGPAKAMAEQWTRAAQPGGPK